MIGAQATIGNDAFGLADYRDYNGQFLDDEAKSDILNAIGPGGVSLHARGTGALPGIQFGSIALFSTTSIVSRATVSRAWAELALEGVEMYDPVHFGATSGELDAWTELGIALGYGLGPLSIGASVKWLHGHFHAQGEATGDLNPTLEDGVIEAVGTSGTLLTTTAEGGQGYGIDLGLAFNLGSTTFSAAASNLFASIEWDTNPRLSGFRYEDQLDFSEEPEKPEEVDEPIDPFIAALPPVWRLGIARPLASRLLFVAALTRIGDDSDIGGGLELRPFSWLPLRIGSGFSSLDGARYTTGFGLSPGPIALDFGVGHRGGLFDDASGIDLALSFALNP
ncbi:MAG: hypothetical protein CME06_08960 [Gemmatimonadetes bacterium]|nr:hypothetical protein [Gemmatimonadota bacterium]